MMKRGLSEVVTNVIIILLVLAAIAIIWAFVRPTIQESGKQIEFSQFSTRLSIVKQSIAVNETNTSVSFGVMRATGAGSLSGVRVVLTDRTGLSKAFTYNFPSFDELETKKISINYTNTSDPKLANVAKIEIVPVLDDGSASGRLGQSSDVYNVLGSENGVGSQTNQTPVNHCTNGIQDMGEAGIDCGGSCAACPNVSVAIISPSAGQYFTPTQTGITLSISASNAQQCTFQITNGINATVANSTIPGCLSTTFGPLGPEGDYNLKVTAKNTITQQTAIAQRTIHTINNPQVILNTGPFTVQKGNSLQHIFSVVTSQLGSCSIQITNTNSTLFSYVVPSCRNSTNGTNIFTIPGSDTNNLSAGIYQLVTSAVNIGGFTGVNSTNLTITNPAPQVMTVSITNMVFLGSPNPTSLNVSYTITNSQVTPTCTYGVTYTRTGTKVANPGTPIPGGCHNGVNSFNFSVVSTYNPVASPNNYRVNITVSNGSSIAWDVQDSDNFMGV